MDCIPLGSSVHGILQTIILEWVAISFSREYSWPRNQTRSPALQADSLPSEPPGKSTTLNDPTIPLLDIHPEEIIIEKDTRILMFTAELFTITKTWKQPRCPSTDERINKLWYMYTMGYYLDIKRNAFESVLIRWMNLEPIVQNELSQKEKNKYCVLVHIYGI